MTIQMTIVGLGQIGASIGLGLANRNPPIHRVGHDIEFSRENQAKKLGAVDATNHNLPSAVRQADVVVLALPLDQVKETLEIIAPDLRENCVVLDTSPIKSGVLEWARQILPAGRHFIGLTPVISGRYLHAEPVGIDGAQADLFKNGLMAIVSPPGTPEGALRLATDLAGSLGAEHMFSDAVEVDSLMAALHLLPQLTAAALVQTTIQPQGWIDGRKLTGRPFAEQTRTVERNDAPAALATAALQASEHTLRVLDRLIQTLLELRDSVQAGDSEKLTEQFRNDQKAYLNWLGERWQGQWSARETSQSEQAPRAGDFMGRLIGLRPRTPKDKPTDKR
jgi:prephenate dehydrogenase